jgi:hypothetical protein
VLAELARESRVVEPVDDLQPPDSRRPEHEPAALEASRG